MSACTLMGEDVFPVDGSRKRVCEDRQTLHKELIGNILLAASIIFFCAAFVIVS